MPSSELILQQSEGARSAVEARRRNAARLRILMVASSALLSGTVFLVLQHQAILQSLLAILSYLKGLYHFAVPFPVRLYVYGCLQRAAKVLFDPVICLLVAGVLSLERIIPAQPDQPLFSSGFLQDCGWCLAANLFFLQWVAVYAAFLGAWYSHHLSFLSLPVASWPLWARGFCTIVGIDLLAWFHHFVRHKVGVFWAFHVIHHSQREMNLFVDYRAHFIDYAIEQTLLFLPIHMFAFGFPYSIYLLYLASCYTKIYHSNLRTNFGFLKHILVTPQSHRIHHSIEPRHWDKNFGAISTIWDRIFGTLHKNYDEYPPTGVSDLLFPWEHNVKPAGVLRNLWKQSLYPFQSLGRRRLPQNPRWWISGKGPS
jgi:sterol desaturase/sphingolipid hydroxylase (fatty acid hydroxylase superfamily)